MLALLLTFTLLTHVLAHPVAEPAPTLAPRQPLIVKREMIDGPLSTIGGPFSDKPQNNKTVVVFPTSNDWCESSLVSPRLPPSPPSPPVSVALPLALMGMLSQRSSHPVTLNTTNYVLWSWSEGFNPNLRVVLTHNDTKLLRGPLMLDDKGKSTTSLLLLTASVCEHVWHDLQPGPRGLSWAGVSHRTS